MFTFPFGAPIPLEFTWPSGVGVEIIVGAAFLVCLQLTSVAMHAGIRRVAQRAADLLTSTRGPKPVPRSAG